MRLPSWGERQMRLGDDRNFAQALKIGRIILSCLKFHSSALLSHQRRSVLSTRNSSHSSRRSLISSGSFEQTTKESGRFNVAARRILSSALHGMERSFVNRIEAALEIAHWTKTERSCCSLHESFSFMGHDPSVCLEARE